MFFTADNTLAPALVFKPHAALRMARALMGSFALLLVSVLGS
jgi:hypothetical protein